MNASLLIEVSDEAAIEQTFERLYDIDLVYVSGCWTLCGNAHCCSFSRYKSRFRILARAPFQEIPLLPGEYDFLARHGWLAQFEPFDRKVIHFPLSDYTITCDSIISRKQNCPCDHATRPVACRLYPLLPVFSLDGSCVSVEELGIYEELEQIGMLPRACQIESLPFDQMTNFLGFTSELAHRRSYCFT